MWIHNTIDHKQAFNRNDHNTCALIGYIWVVHGRALLIDVWMGRYYPIISNQNLSWEILWINQQTEWRCGGFWGVRPSFDKFSGPNFQTKPLCLCKSSCSMLRVALVVIVYTHIYIYDHICILIHIYIYTCVFPVISSRNGTPHLLVTSV